METIKISFRARCREIAHYLNLLQFVEESGSLLVSPDGTKRLQIDVTTRHVLKASVFVHLYNLVESIVSACLKRVSQEIRTTGLPYADINREWQRCWVREMGRTNDIMNPEKRLKALLRMCDQLLAEMPIEVQPNIPTGSLDDQRIESLLKEHGIILAIQPALKTAVRQHVLQTHGPLKLVRVRRNALAHGLESFGDCGRDVSVLQLRRWTAIIFWYMRRIICHFDLYLESDGFKRRTTA